MNTRDSLKINEKGNLEIGGCDALQLAARFGTPLYVFDKSRFDTLARGMLASVTAAYGPDSEIAYASKAFACEGVYVIAKNLGLSVDVVSAGELYLALRAGVPAAKIYFHGNAKTDFELEYAVKSGVGAIVLEGLDEAERISNIANEQGVRQGVMVRVNPGVEAHTHSFVQTAKTDSKFGIQLDDNALFHLIKNIDADCNLSFLGIHTHIGSQIFEVEPYLVTVEKLIGLIKKLNEMGVGVGKLNLGGGFGVKYTEADPNMDVAEYDAFISTIAKKVVSLCGELGINKPTLVFEPGRALVADAGVTLYTVCAVKNIERVRKYVSVDGGMFDNPRYALYGARYEATCVKNADAPKKDIVTIAGKCCESGDLITVDARLQQAKVGDILAVFTTGAYNYSMASNYNLNAVPPVVIVENGSADYLVKPQTLEDIARNNVVPESLKRNK